MYQLKGMKVVFFSGIPNVQIRYPIGAIFQSLEILFRG
jgi:hypothetical protein